MENDYRVIKRFYRWFTVKDKSNSEGCYITVRKADTCYGKMVYQYFIGSPPAVGEARPV